LTGRQPVVILNGPRIRRPGAGFIPAVGLP
jgi:hypothetical protein